MALPAKERPKAASPVEGVEPGDLVYVRHEQRGPIAVRVLAHGRDGLTGECDQKQRHRVTWDRFLGHKTRMLHRYRVIDQGADGALLEDGSGRRRYLKGHLPIDAGDAGGADPAARAQRAGSEPPPRPDDPLLGGMDRLHKAEVATMDIPAGARVLFMKAGAPIANRAGLALQAETDKAGHQIQRWKRTSKDAPKGSMHPAQQKDAPPAHGAPFSHGDVVPFRHGNVGGEGKIVASGRDGVTIQDKDGQTHQVRHENLVQPGGEAKAGGAETGTPAPAADPAPLFTPEETKGLPKDAVQPVKGEAELFTKSAEALDQLAEWLDRDKGVCSRLGFETMKVSPDDADLSKKGGMLFIAPLKGKKRAAEKVASDYGGDWSRLVDTVRCSLAVDSYDEIGPALDALRKGGMKLARQPKDRFSKPVPVGYRDMLLNVTLPNGIVGEVQLHVKPMLTAKAKGHHHYEIERSLQAKKGGDLSDEDRQHLDAAIKAQSEIYNSAWQAAYGGSDQGDMRKAMDAAKAFAYFDHDGAYFRRGDHPPFRSVDDVLVGKEWQPYKGSDPLAPALYGDEVENPLGVPGAGDGGGDGDGGSGDSSMAKAAETAPLVIFRKAIIAGGAAGDLFPSQVPVKGHMRDGHYVAPFTATRHKRVDVPAADKAPEALLRGHPEEKADPDPSPDIKHFYVSAIDGARKYFVAGPYATHEEAKGRVEEVRRHAAETQPGREAFMAWGTAGSAEPIKTPLGPNWKKPPLEPPKSVIVVATTRSTSRRDPPD